MTAAWQRLAPLVCATAHAELQATLLPLHDTGDSRDALAACYECQRVTERLLPVVEKLAAERAAEELRAAIEVIDGDWHEQCAGNRNMICESCRTYSDVLDRLRARAAALAPEEGR